VVGLGVDRRRALPRGPGLLEAPLYDKLIADAREELDQDKRMGLLEEAERIQGKARLQKPYTTRYIEQPYGGGRDISLWRIKAPPPCLQRVHLYIIPTATSTRRHAGSGIIRTDDYESEGKGQGDGGSGNAGLAAAWCSDRSEW
jgi:hypothetical protein